MNYKRYKQVVNIGCQFFKEHTLNMCTIFLVITAEMDMYYQAIKSNISYVKASLSYKYKYSLFIFGKNLVLFQIFQIVLELEREIRERWEYAKFRQQIS